MTTTATRNTGLAAANAAKEAEALYRAEDVLWLVRRGEYAERAAARCDVTLEAVAKTLRKYRRHDDWETIAAARLVPLNSRR